ncbi:MAG: hypothetical protein R6V59_01095 [Dehalococcoidia bacterium]
MRRAFAVPFTVVLVMGFSLASALTAEIHDSCDAATLTITAIGEILDEVQEYDLALNSTAGGSVTLPGEGTFSYDEGTDVDLEATSDTGHRFVNWTGDVDTIADADAATTTITINGDCFITANFEKIPPTPVNWALIGGIIAAVVGGLVIFFTRRKRATQAKRD